MGTHPDPSKSAGRRTRSVGVFRRAPRLGVMRRGGHAAYPDTRRAGICSGPPAPVRFDAATGILTIPYMGGATADTGTGACALAATGARPEIAFDVDPVVQGDQGYLTLSYVVRILGRVFWATMQPDGTMLYSAPWEP